MVKYVLISIAIYIVLIAIIVLLVWLLFRKRQTKIVEYNKNIENKIIDLDKVDKLSRERKKEIDNAFKKAQNFDDIKRIFTNM